MINLFNRFDCKIDTTLFAHHLHDECVHEFENKFCYYVGGKYACALNSATTAIFLVLTWLKMKQGSALDITIPSVIPPVVPNAIIQSQNNLLFNDITTWVGGSYILYQNHAVTVIDSAQEIKRSIPKYNTPYYISIYSFYPTKPLGGLDGGMVVTNIPELYEWLRVACMNGTTKELYSWERKVNFVGWKVYMSSFQAAFLLQRLQHIDQELANVAIIRSLYNKELGGHVTSDHLYTYLSRRTSGNNVRLQMMAHNIVCGKHYSPCHMMLPYAKYASNLPYLNSEFWNQATVSLPMHSGMTKGDGEMVISTLNKIIKGSDE